MIKPTKFNLIILGFFALLFLNCSDNESLKSSFAVDDLPLIPKPNKIHFNDGVYQISDDEIIEVVDESLKPAARLLADYIGRVTGKDVQITTTESKSSTIFFALDTTLAENHHALRIDDKINLNGESYEAIANGVSSLVQLIQSSEKSYFIPKASIEDGTDIKYRSVMLDLARFWHPVESIKETIDLLWLYKLNYLHLHLSDSKNFTFPLPDFPKVNVNDADGNRQYYTKEELTELVEYAKNRGIAIIPEIDLPGHSNILWNTYPEVFGSIDPVTNKAAELYVVNMANEKTYTAVNNIIKEMAQIFYTSPYIHVGGDEVYLENLKKIKDYEVYTKAKGLDDATNGDANGLFCHFINRMNQMVKATGKKTIVWEGFKGTGSKNVTVDKDIAVIVWNTTYNHPKNLIDNGYEVINSTWVPWYMVEAMNFATDVETAFNWQITDWTHWKNSIDDIKLENSDGLIGAQISFWEQNYYKVVPVLRDRVPILASYLWQGKQLDTFEDFSEKMTVTDTLFETLFEPAPMTFEGLVQEDDLKFDTTAKVILRNSDKNSYRWSFSKKWGFPDMTKAKKYSEPIALTESGILTIAKLNSEGTIIGHPKQEYVQRIEPLYNYKVYGPAPRKSWDSVPDVSAIPVLREGVMGRMTDERLNQINGELFAKVDRKGHIDTRVRNMYNPYAMELNTTLKIDKEEDYTIRLLTHDGLADIYIDEEVVAKGSQLKKEAEEFEIALAAGEHRVRIVYFYRKIQNQLNIQYKTANMKDFAPFENILTPSTK